MSYIKRFFKIPKQSFFLFGPRGTGKSTYLKKHFKNAIWVDLLKPEILRYYKAFPERLRELLIANPDKKVVVIGGGDTGADCVGIAHRQGASCIVQVELLAKPPTQRNECYPWPAYPMLLKSSTSHEEGGERFWSVLTKKFLGQEGKVKKLSCVRVEFKEKDDKGCSLMQELPDSAFDIEADLIILAVGFLHPEHNRLVTDLKLGLDSRGNVKTNNKYMSSRKGVFSAGDMHRGQSLVVWAIFEGLNAASSIDEYLNT